MSVNQTTLFTGLGKFFAAFANVGAMGGSQPPTNVYEFTVTSANATVGATYTNNGVTFTVLATISSGTTLLVSGVSAPGASGTLTKASGTGDATITFASFVEFALWGASGPVIKNALGTESMYNDIFTILSASGVFSLLPTAQSLPALQGLDAVHAALKQALVVDATSFLILTVNNAVPQTQPTSLEAALIAEIQQMQTATASVKRCVVSSTVAAGADNTGTATVYASLYDPNGLLLEYSNAEIITLQCTQDQNSGAVAGSEQITITSPAAATSTLSNLWPQGSGLNLTTTVVDPTQGNGQGNGNLLTGSTTATNVGIFKAWSAGLPVACIVLTDPGNVSDGTTAAYSGAAHCLQFTGNAGGTDLHTAVYQPFANNGVTGGSTQELLPNTVYNFYCQIVTSAVPAAGAIGFSLTDGANNVLNNNAGVPNTISVLLTSAGIDTTSYVPVTGSFQTPTIMPSTGVRLRIEATTQVSTSTNVFMDFFALVQAASNGPAMLVGGGNYGGLYAGGPYLSVFRGNVDLVRYVSPTLGDAWTATIANNNGSSSPTPLSMQTMANQFFGLANLGLILPSASSPTIQNSLIS